MKIKYFIYVIMLILIFAFPQKVKAEEISLWVLSYDAENEFIWNAYKFDCEEDISDALHEAYGNLFANAYKGYGFPEGTKLLYINLHEGHLTLNVSSEIKDYGGGRFYENVLTVQILKTALDIPRVDKVTLLIDGMLIPLPEGTIIEEVTEWQDMTQEKTMN